MNIRLGTGLAILTLAGSLFAVACSDDESTTPPAGTTTTTTTTTQDACAVACHDLYVCGQAECPEWTATDPTEEDYLNGTTSDGCLAACAASPALTALVDPDDCATTVATISGVNPTFNESCNGATGGGGAGGSTGGSGGSGGATGGSGGATGGSGGAGGG